MNPKSTPEAFVTYLKGKMRVSLLNIAWSTANSNCIALKTLKSIKNPFPIQTGEEKELENIREQYKGYLTRNILAGKEPLWSEVYCLYEKGKSPDGLLLGYSNNLEHVSCQVIKKILESLAETPEGISLEVEAQWLKENEEKKRGNPPV